MSEAHVHKFADIVAKDPALLARLGLEQVSDKASASTFLTKAVNEAKAVGLQFTAEEADKWMRAEMAPKSRGELSDTQLEAVAGGKGQAAPVSPKPAAKQAQDWQKELDAQREKVIRHYLATHQ